MGKKIWLEHELKQGTPEWQEFRSHGLGGSEVACLMGMNPWSTPQELFRNKTGRSQKVFDESQMKVIERGNFHEDEARKWYSSVTGHDIEPLCAVHNFLPWMRTSLDSITKDRKIIQEYKVPSSPASHKKQMSKAMTAWKRGRQSEPGSYIPEWRYPQMQHQLEVMHSHFDHCVRGHYVSYSPEEPENSVIVEVTFNDPFINVLLARECVFMEYLMKDEEPPESAFDTTMVGDDDLLVRPSNWFIRDFEIEKTQKVIYANGEYLC